MWRSRSGSLSMVSGDDVMESWAIAFILQRFRRFRVRKTLSLMLYILKMLLQWIKCKITHSILLNFCSEVEFIHRKWWRQMIFWGIRQSWDNYDSTAQCNAKNQVKNVWIDLVLWRWRTIDVIVRSWCGRVNKIPITCTQNTQDHAKANTEKAEQRNWDTIAQSANSSSL